MPSNDENARAVAAGLVNMRPWSRGVMSRWDLAHPFIDVIERVFDKGVVIDAFVKDRQTGIEMADVRVSVAPLTPVPAAPSSPLPVFGSGASSRPAASVDDDDEGER
jgi:hypothetical protein